MRLDFKKPIQTRKGNKVRIYHIYQTYMHGAYEFEGEWYIARWRLSGYFHEAGASGQLQCNLDLVNVSNEEIEKEYA
jgi:hypothetical protein